MLESFNGNTFEYQRITPEEKLKRGILGRLVGVIADAVNPTRNGRLYGKALWLKVIDDPIFREKVENKAMVGEFEHPTDSRESIDPERICICLSEIPKINDKGQLVGVFDILDTPFGRILKTLVDYGTRIGVSSRGSGDLFTNYEGQEEVDPDSYDCVCWDAVFTPSVKAARPQYVTESLGSKTLNESLDDIVNQFDGEQRLKLSEAVENLKLRLVEEAVEDKEENSPDAPDYPSAVKYLVLKQFQGSGDYKIDYHHRVKTVHCATKKDLADQIIDAFSGERQPNDTDLFKVQEELQINKEGDTILTEEPRLSKQELIDLPFSSSFMRNRAVVKVDGKEYTHIGKDKWEYVPPQERALPYSLTTDELLSKGPAEILEDGKGNAITESRNCINNRIGIEYTYPGDEISDFLGHITVSGTCDEDSAVEFAREYVKKNINSLAYKFIVDDTIYQNVPIVDINTPSGEVSNAKSNDVDIIHELQETLKLNAELQHKVIELQEKLSVCYAKEAKQEESALKLNKSIADLSNKSAMVEGLQKRVDTLSSQLDLYRQLRDKKASLVKSLQESVKDTTLKAVKLQEECNSLVESKNSRIKELSDKVATLTESLALKENEVTKQAAQYSKKLEASNALVEKYLKIATKAVDKYIVSEALKLGVDKNEIKNRLPESYGFNDIDKVCQDLQSILLGRTKLPYRSFDLQPLKESAGVRVRSAEKSIAPANRFADDDVDDSLFQLAGLI